MSFLSGRSSNTSLATNPDSTPWRCNHHRVHRDSKECNDSPPSSPITGIPAKRARIEGRDLAQNSARQVSQGTPSKAPRPQQATVHSPATRGMALLGTARSMQRPRDLSPLEQRQDAFNDSGIILPTSPTVQPSPPPAGAISPLELSGRGAAFSFDQRRPSIMSIQSDHTGQSSQAELAQNQEGLTVPDIEVARTTTITRESTSIAGSQASSSHRVPETPDQNRPLPAWAGALGRALMDHLRRSRSPSVETLPLPNISNIQDPAAAEVNADGDPATVDVNTDGVARLRESRNALTKELNQSTALVHRLRTRAAIHAADNAVHLIELETIRHGKSAAEERAAEERILRKTWTGLCLMIVVGMSVYAYVCWWNGAEMEFVKTRRRERFGL